MALAVAQVGGNVTTVAGTITATFGSSTTAGSLIVACGMTFGATSPMATGDVTDNKSNPNYTLRQGVTGGASGDAAAIYDDVGGSRGASHQLSYNPINGTGDNNNIGMIEITGADTSTPYDSTTGATNNDSTSPYSITAAGAISGNQIAIYVCSADLTGNSAWTQPTGYSNIINQPDSANFPSICSYKINETGTPSPAASNAQGITAAGAHEAFATYKEAAASGFDVPLLQPPYQATVWRM